MVITFLAMHDKNQSFYNTMGAKKNVYPQSYGHWNLKNDSFYVLSYKKSVLVWARYLNASERSYLVLLQNNMYSGVLTYH